MAANHTPGRKAYLSPPPWTIEPEVECEDTPGVFVLDVHKNLICTVWPDDTGDREQRDDNAHLIAAAPDLLEACQVAVGVYEAAKLCGLADRLPGYKSCLADLLAAIAKAEGQPSTTTEN